MFKEAAKGIGYVTELIEKSTGVDGFQLFDRAPLGERIASGVVQFMFPITANILRDPGDLATASGKKVTAILTAAGMIDLTTSYLPFMYKISQGKVAEAIVRKVTSNALDNASVDAVKKLISAYK